MSQLFSKKIKVGASIICICVLFYGFKSNFKNTDQDSFLTLCKNSDAYYLHSYTDAAYMKNWSRYKSFISINNKLVVNNANGVEKYAFLTLSEYESNHIKKIKVRTLKKDGSIVELDSSLVFQKKAKNKKFGEINYPIPAVEPGDTIETTYTYYENLKLDELIGYVSLHSDIPSKNTQYTVQTTKDLGIRYKTYNNFPEPEIVSNDSLVYLQFSMDKIKGFENNDYSCFPCELPYLYYSLEKKDSELRTWKDVYNEEFNFLTQPLAIDTERSSYYKRWKKRLIGEAKDSSKYYKFNLLFNEVSENFNIDVLKGKEFIKSNGYFLKEKRFDVISIRRFYRQILEDLEIPYWAVFGKSKLSGNIDPYYIRKGEYDHIFFAFENKDKKLIFLYPHSESYKYQIDEIPTSLYNTNAILIKPILTSKKKKKDKFISRDLKFAEVDSISRLKVKLPGLSSNQNYLNQIVYSKVDIKKRTTSFKYMFKVSGGSSTDLRTFLNMMNENEEVNDFYNALSEYEGEDNTMQIDTVTQVKLKNHKPYTYYINAEGKLNNTVTFLNDSLVSISFDKLINHNQIETNTDAAALNYYLDYSYSDNFMLNLQFPCKIEVLGLDDGKVNFKNDFGEYYFELKQNNKNQLIVKSNYKILQNQIPKENYQELKLLNQKVKNSESKRLIVKLKI